MTPFKAKIDIALWRMHCAWCEVKKAFKALSGDPWETASKKKGI